MIAVIADDFTGAAEIGGVGLKYGLKVVIETEVKQNGLVDLLVISADTRSLSAKQASREIEKITRELVEMKPRYIYKKLDSVLRGNILDEINAQLKVTGKKLSILVAANPSFGRVIEDGIYKVNSVPLAETSFADDPDFPIRSSRVTDIVGKAEIPAFSLPVDSAIPEKGVVIGDVKDEKEMRSWAEKIDEYVMPAGGAGFFDMLIKRNHRELKQTCDGCMTLGKGTLFVFGSKFPRSLQLPLGLSKKETVKLNMPDEIYRNAGFNEELLNDWAKEVVANLKKERKVIVSTDQNYSNEPGLSARIRKCVAALVGKVSKETPLTDLLIEGGATTSQILNELGIKKLYPSKLLHPGIIQMTTPVYPGLTITTKPGSYLWPDGVTLKESDDLSMELS